MKWKDIKFFDNKVVCELIEAANPPGIFRILDDVCRSVHAADADTVDQKFVEKLATSLSHEHLSVAPSALQFTVKHYAGDVTYDSRNFPFKNKDTLFTGLVLCMQVSIVHTLTKTARRRPLFAYIMIHFRNPKTVSSCRSSLKMCLMTRAHLRLLVSRFDNLQDSLSRYLSVFFFFFFFAE